MRIKDYGGLILSVVLLALLCACGGSGGSSGGGSSIVVNPDADAVEIRTSLDNNTTLSHGGTFTLDAYVTYLETTDTGAEIRKPIANGTLVTFTIEQGGGSITNAKATQNGVATATYQGGTYGGIVTVKASVNENVYSEYSFEVAPSDIGAIYVKSVLPENKTINVRGTGKTNIAQIEFEVTDAFGNPVTDGRTVFFDIPTPLSGGEKLSTSETNTLNGVASVALQSGTVAGSLVVRATYPANDGTSISTEAKITIVSGMPDAKHISIAAEYLNIAGGVQLGLQNTITAYLGDRYGNVVPDGTPVSFITEGGTIGESSGFTTTTTFGVAEAVLQTSNPTVPELDGNDPTANPGWCRVVVYTPGSEAYYDANGNGVYDEGIDSLTLDMSDPYIDANDNGRYDVGEVYIDANGDGVFTPADGVYQSDTTIWTSMNVLFSDHIAPLDLTPENFDIKIGECQSFAFNVGDLHGNALVSGTEISVDATAGEILGLDSLTLADTAGPGFVFTFKLCSEQDQGAEVENSQVTVTVTPPGDTSTAPGNNGAELIALATGTINNINPDPTPPTPTLEFTLPNKDAVDVPVNSPIQLVFSEVMNEATFTGANIYIEKQVENGDNVYYPVEVEFYSKDRTQVYLKHRDNKKFDHNTAYMVTLKTALRSEAGQALTGTETIPFTTAPN